MTAISNRLTCLLLLAAGVVHAQCPVERPISAGSYESGVTFDPKTHSGFDVDVMDELAHRTGCRFALSYDSRVRLWSKLTEGQLDMMVSALDLPDRQAYARFIVHSWTRTVVLAHQQPGFPTSPQAFLADHHLLSGSVKTYRYSPGVDEWVNQLRNEGRTYDAPDTPTLIKVFDAGRVAVITIPPESLAEIGHRYPVTQPYARLHWFDRFPKAGGGLALSRATLPPALGDLLQKEMDQMRADGSLLRIASKYFDRNAAVDFIKPD